VANDGLSSYSKMGGGASGKVDDDACTIGHLSHEYWYTFLCCSGSNCALISEFLQKEKNPRVPVQLATVQRNWIFVCEGDPAARMR